MLLQNMRQQKKHQKHFLHVFVSLMNQQENNFFDITLKLINKIGQIIPIIRFSLEAELEHSPSQLIWYSMCSFLYVLGSPSRNCAAVGHRPHRRHPGVRLQHSVRRGQESNPGAAAGSRAGQIPRNCQDDCQSLS